MVKTTFFENLENSFIISTFSVTLNLRISSPRNHGHHNKKRVTENITTKIFPPVHISEVKTNDNKINIYISYRRLQPPLSGGRVRGVNLL